MKPFIVLACGGRDFTHRGAVFKVLDEIHGDRPIATLVHGDAQGADTLAEQWAVSRNVSSHAYPARWKKHGRAAGPIRNKLMLRRERPDLVVAFPGGRGTEHMTWIAQASSHRVQQALVLPMWGACLVDPGIARILQVLNEHGYVTAFSCSGLAVDHPDEHEPSGYMLFHYYEHRVIAAAEQCGLRADKQRPTPWRSYGGLGIYLPEGLSDNSIRSRWLNFAHELTGVWLGVA